uniref:Uncharacterized protein n=1 Tax=Megaselia scalaris TaxID=36166 RepID=T1GBG9_MEGSC
PKPRFQSALKRPGFSSNPVKTILPSDRIRNANAIPLTKDIANLTERPRVRAASPEAKPRPEIKRTHLRRSKSVSDMKDMLSRPLKRPDPTMAPIPAKVGKVTSKPLTTSKSV